MTIGIVIACADGVVVGADRKAVRHRGTRVKSLEDKIAQFQFRDRKPLLFCVAGGADVGNRAIDRLNPVNYGEDADAEFYRDFCERQVSRLAAELTVRGLEYDATLLLGMIDSNNHPFIGHITGNGLTESKRSGYFTAGIGAPYAEMVLKDSFSLSLTCEDARLIVAGLIDAIGKVDNDVEGLDVFSISSASADVVSLTQAERQALSFHPLSFDFKDDLQEIKEEIIRWQELEKSMERSISEASKPAS